MKVNATIAKRKLSSALKRKIPQNTDHIFRVCEKAQQLSKNYNYWNEPFTVIYAVKRMILVRSLDGKRKYLFNYFQIKPYAEEEKSESTVNGEKRRKKKYSTGIKEVITKGGPRETHFYHAKREVLQTIYDRGKWDIVSKEDVPHNANISEGRSVLAVEEEGTKNGVRKAIFVDKGYRNKLKPSLVHNSATI